MAPIYSLPAESNSLFRKNQNPKIKSISHAQSHETETTDIEQNKLNVTRSSLEYQLLEAYSQNDFDHYFSLAEYYRSHVKDANPTWLLLEIVAFLQRCQIDTAQKLLKSDALSNFIEPHLKSLKLLALKSKRTSGVYNQKWSEDPIQGVPSIESAPEKSIINSSQKAEARPSYFQGIYRWKKPHGLSIQSRRIHVRDLCR